jgi:hypothetical protein
MKFLWNSHPHRDEKWKIETKRNVSTRAWDQEFESLSFETSLNIDNKQITIGELYDNLS